MTSNCTSSTNFSKTDTDSGKETVLNIDKKLNDELKNKTKTITKNKISVINTNYEREIFKMKVIMKNNYDKLMVIK